MQLYRGKNRIWPRLDGVSFNQLIHENVMAVESEFTEDEVKEAVFFLA